MESKLRQKYLILANSVAYDTELQITEADYTNSDLSDDDIIHELNDTHATYNQMFMNAIILTENDVSELKEKLLK